MPLLLAYNGELNNESLALLETLKETLQLQLKQRVYSCSMQTEPSLIDTKDSSLVVMPLLIGNGYIFQKYFSSFIKKIKTQYSEVKSIGPLIENEIELDLFCNVYYNALKNKFDKLHKEKVIVIVDHGSSFVAPDKTLFDFTTTQVSIRLQLFLREKHFVKEVISSSLTEYEKENFISFKKAISEISDTQNRQKELDISPPVASIYQEFGYATHQVKMTSSKQYYILKLFLFSGVHATHDIPQIITLANIEHIIEYSPVLLEMPEIVMFIVEKLSVF